MSVFAASDIVEVAIRIEENGVNFYKFAEQIAKKEDEKKLFAGLAQAKVAHKKTFEKLFAGMEKSNLQESYEGEFGEYLRAYRRLAIVDAERETGGQLPAEAEASGMDAVGMAQRFDVRQ